MARTISFTNSYPYSTPTALRPLRRPEVPVRFFNVKDHSQYLDLNMLVDSGADTTCLPPDIAQALGIDVTTLPVAVSRGVTGRASAYHHDGILIVLAGKAVRCPVLFVPGLPVFLLGRAVVFDEFIFGFEQRADKVHVRVSHKDTRFKRILARTSE